MRRSVLVEIASLRPYYGENIAWILEYNDALRNINRGKADFVPYYEEIPGYALVMTAELRPRGTGKPPAVGLWQLAIRKREAPYELLLQGMVLKGIAYGTLALFCESETLWTEIQNLEVSLA